MAKFVYTGQENLEAMKVAVNYNNYLVSWVTKSITKKDCKILDFGAGIGTYADLLKAQGIIVDCLEIDKSQVNLLKKKGYKAYSDLSKVNEKYDIIYAFNVFEHIENDSEVYATLNNLLAKNGQIIIYVPAFKVLFSTMDTLVGHHRRYNLKMLKAIAEASKMDIIKNSYCDPLGFFAALVFKFFGNNNGTITPKSVKAYDKFVFPVSKLVEPVTSKLFGKNAVLITKKKS